ncbi:MAG TPA: hypothetical protein VNV87_15980, partial [Acidimicrobiales bacterium]|nr:hypothetical protein [Acidimicrobiales bacterium]
HGKGYVYPHDEPGAWTEQQYRPPELGEARYYEPSDRGHEAVVAERLRHWRGESGSGSAIGRASPESGGAIGPASAGSGGDEVGGEGGTDDEVDLSDEA